MVFKTANLLTVWANLAVFVSLLNVPAVAAPPRCEMIDGGVEYRAYLADQKRYVYVSVRTLSGYTPSVIVVADKNYEAGKAKITAGDPLVNWWLDRSRPMRFSTNQVVVHWKNTGTLNTVASWIITPDTNEVKQPIRGLEPDGTGFSGMGSVDTNAFAFQTRLEMPDFNSDSFDVSVPEVSFDGVTVTPPVIHFTRDDGVISVKC